MRLTLSTSWRSMVALALSLFFFHSVSAVSTPPSNIFSRWATALKMLLHDVPSSSSSPSLPPSPEATLMKTAVSEYGPIDAWSVETTAQFMTDMKFSPVVVNHFLVHEVGGNELAQLSKFSTKLQKKYGMQHLYDLKKWNATYHHIDEQYQLDRLSTGTGAEDLDLWSLIQHNPGESRAFLILLARHPHLALGALRYKYGAAIDDAMFGKDETEAKSPWSSVAFALFPGATACRYVLYFFDTNPFLTVLLIVSYVTVDLNFYVELVLFATGSKRDAAKSFFCWRLLSAIVGGVIAHEMFSREGSRDDWKASAIVTYSSLFLLVIYNVWTLKKLLFDAKFTIVWYTTEKVVTVEHEKKKVREAMKKYEDDPSSVLQKADPRALYNWDESTKLGKGGFGTTYRGTRKTEPVDEEVAVKFMNKAESKEEEANEDFHGKENLAFVALGILFGVGVGARDLEMFNTQKFWEDSVPATARKRRNWKIEVRNHFAIQALEHPSLLKFCSAHENNGTPIIVTKLINPHGLRGQPLRVRLSAVQTLFSGVAALHAAGIVHRDLKITNVGVALEDPSRAVIFDFGISEIPYADASEDTMVGAKSPAYLAPEVKNLPQVSHATIRMTHGYKGPPTDVWAAALTAIECVLFGLDCRTSQFSGQLNETFIWDIFYLGLREHSYVLNPDEKATFDAQIAQLKEDDPYCIKLPILLWINLVHTPNTVKAILRVVRDNWDATVPGVDDFCDVISRMLSLERKARPTMKEVASDKFFQNNKLGEFRQSKVAFTSLGEADRMRAALLLGGAAERKYEAATASELRDKDTGDDAVVADDKSCKPVSRASGSLRMLSALSAKLAAEGRLPASPTKQGNASSSIIANIKRDFNTYADEIDKEIKSKEKMVALLKGSGIQERLSWDDSRSGALWDLLDLDGNGSVSKLEMFSGLAILLAPTVASTTRAQLLFLACDEDDDGRISQQEMVKLLVLFDWEESDAARFFANMDDEKVGSISNDKFLGGMAGVQLLRDSGKAVGSLTAQRVGLFL